MEVWFKGTVMKFSLKKWLKCLLKPCPCWQEAGELIFRVTLSLFIMTHGWGKLVSFSEKADVFPDPIGLGSCLSLSLALFAEFFCGILLLVGLLTRFAAFTLLITMLVAGLIFHFDDPFNQKELALLYAAGFLYFTAAGGNRASIDACLRKKWFPTS